MVMLVGMPGSGKSTFGKTLAGVDRGNRWTYISQDDIGSRRLCEEALGRAVLGKNSRRKVILDRCNADVEDRKFWMGLAMVEPKEVLVIFFDVQKDTCIARVLSRPDHPSIPSGTGTRAVESFAKLLVAPTKAEGYADVITVRDFQQADDLLDRFGAPHVDMAALHPENKQQQQPGEVEEEVIPHGFDASQMSNILRLLRVEEGDVLNMYLMGSRLWGTHTHASDYDFLIVVRNTKATAKSKTTTTMLGEKANIAVHAGEYDAGVMTETEFIARLARGEMHECVLAWAPRHCVWKETIDPRKHINTRDIRPFMNNILEEATKDWAKAEKMIAKGDLQRGRKVLIHCLRGLMFGVQIITHRAVHDITAANILHKEICSHDHPDWGFYRDTYNQKYQEWKRQLANAAVTHK
eukprot:TRINITY_DN6351_c0_g1_i3.p1 TRINITY_DN6351_c0_g1~~TRINITY_DN6351_c0_g1_i3.p1  ORF type:complete len:409 (-),score=87.48 TRINITY_DN6351_c0_g1_i3:11-1237(-)